LIRGPRLSAAGTGPQAARPAAERAEGREAARSAALDGEELWISQQLTRVNRQLLHRQTTKTEGSEASLPLLGMCISVLRHRQRVQEGTEKGWGEAEGIRPRFHDEVWNPVEPRKFNRAFEAHCRNAGVLRIRVHDTRRTCASLLAVLDVHPRVAMCILWHTKIAVTMEIYTQIPSEETRKALAQLSHRLKSDG